MDISQKINFYKFSKNSGVVEVFIDVEFETIKDKLDEFMIEDKNLPKSDWQVLYMEQYFTANRLTKICDTYDEPERDTKNFFLVFFLYKLTEGQVLHTPFGNVTVSKMKELPTEYKKKLEFEDYD